MLRVPPTTIARIANGSFLSLGICRSQVPSGVATAIRVMLGSVLILAGAKTIARNGGRQSLRAC